MKLILKNTSLVFQSLSIPAEIEALFGTGGYTTNTTIGNKVALSNLIQGLQTAGIWSKIKKLYIPIFGTSVNDAMLDIKSSYNSTNIIDTCNTGTIEMSQNGGVNILAQTSNPAMSFSSLLAPNNLHWGLVCASCQTKSSARTTCIFKGTGYSTVLSLFGSLKVVFDGAITSVDNSKLVLANTYAQNEQDEYCHVNVYASGGNYNHSVDSASESGYNKVKNETTLATVRPLSSDWTQTPEINDLKFVTLGERLTDAECAAYSTLVDTFLANVV